VGNGSFIKSALKRKHFFFYWKMMNISLAGLHTTSKRKYQTSYSVFVVQKEQCE